MRGAMPRHKGSATKKTTSDAGTSARKTSFKGGGRILGVGFGGMSASTIVVCRRCWNFQRNRPRRLGGLYGEH